jgi:hypothetical protein
MLFKSPVYSQASGSIAGITYSHNTAGMYTRARVAVTNPNTARQAAVRLALADLVAIWTQTLDDTQRAEWAAYAAEVPLIGRLGDPIHVGGLAMFIRSNVPRVTVYDGSFTGKPTNRVTLSGPTTLELPAPPTVSAMACSGNNFTCTIANTFPATSEDALLIVAVARPVPATINFSKGPYRILDTLVGDTPAPTSFAAAITTAWPAAGAVGSRLFYKITGLYADGRYSVPVLGNVIMT